MSKHRRNNKPQTTRRAQAPALPPGAAVRPVTGNDPSMALYGDNRTPASEINGPQGVAATTFLPGTPIRATPGLGDGASGPRVYGYTIGGNIAAVPRSNEAVSFAELRALAQNYYGIGLCEEVHDRIIQRLEPRLIPRDGVVPDGEDASDPKWTEPARRMAEWLEDGPNGPADGRDLHGWLVALNRDLMEIDAGAIYHSRTRGGWLLGLRLIAGDTIQVLDDLAGERPRPPDPAYRQVLYGAPGVAMTSEDMDYLCYSSRTNDRYGIAPVERILLIVNMALRKEELDLRRWTDGSTPAGLLQTVDPRYADWTPEQIRLYQEQWNNILAGNSALRMRTQVVLPGWKFEKTEPEDITSAFDRWLLNITAAEFGVSMDELGFTETSNRSTGEAQEAATYRNAVKPRSDFLARYLTRVIRRYDGTPLAPRGQTVSRPGSPTKGKGVWDARYKVSWGGIQEPEDITKKISAASEMMKSGLRTKLQAVKWAGLPIDQGEEDVPAFIVAQGGIESVVVLADIEAHREANKTALATQQQTAQIGLKQQELQTQMLEQQVKQYTNPPEDEGFDFGDEGTEEPPPEGGPEGTKGAASEPEKPEGEEPANVKPQQQQKTDEEEHANGTDDQPRRAARAAQSRVQRGERGLPGRGGDTMGLVYGDDWPEADDTGPADHSTDRGASGGGAVFNWQPNPALRGTADLLQLERTLDAHPLYQLDTRTGDISRVGREQPINRSVAIPFRGTGAGDETDGDSEKASAEEISDEWARYREKAVRAAKRGQTIPAFTSAILPPELHAWVAGELARVTTADEVRGVFQAAREAEEMRRGVAVFGAGHKIIGNVGEDGTFHPVGIGHPLEPHVQATLHQHYADIANARAELSQVRDVGSRNFYKVQISGHEYRIRQTLRDNGLQLGSHYSTKITDGEFRSAFVDSYQKHVDASGFANIRAMQNEFKTQYGMSPKEFSNRLNAMRESGERGEHPLRLHFEQTEEDLYRPVVHTHAGNQYNFVSMADISRGEPGFYGIDPYAKTGGIAQAGPIARAKTTEIYDSPAIQDVLSGKSTGFSSDRGSEAFLGRIFDEQGFNGRPDVLSTAQMDAAIRRGDREVWRGDSQSRYAEQFQTGTRYVGRGVYGSGTYVHSYPGRPGSSKYDSRRYTNENGVGSRMALKSGANVITDRELTRMQGAQIRQISKMYAERWRNAKGKAAKDAVIQERNRLIRAAVSDPGRFAALKGYDAIDLTSQGGTMIILNRTAVQVDSHLYTRAELH